MNGNFETVIFSWILKLTTKNSQIISYKFLIAIRSWSKITEITDKFIRIINIQDRNLNWLNTKSVNL